MFLSKTLHTGLLKAAEQNGVNKMLTWGGVGAGVGGAYGMFSDTGTTMEGAFKGAILGGGAAAGLKYYGNRYATGMGHVVGESLDTLEKSADFSATNPAAFNKALNSSYDLGMMSQQFNPAYFGIGQSAKFSDNVLNATSINKRVAQAFQEANTSYTGARGSMSDTDFIAGRLGTAERDRSSSIYSSSNSLIKDLRSKYGSV